MARRRRSPGRAGTAPSGAAPMTPEELVAAVCPKIRDLGWAYYFDAETVAVGEARRPRHFHFYVLGRGGVLGDVEPEVVAGAFGYFNPAVVALLWNEGRAILSPREAARVHWACAADLGRARFSELPGLEEVARPPGRSTTPPTRWG